MGRVVRGAGLRPQAASSTVVEHLFEGMLKSDSESGEVVTPEKAVSLPAVFRAVRLFSETAGALPFITYRLEGGGERERDPDHPSFELLHEEPNPTLSAAEFWTMVFNHLTSWGRVIVGKQFDGIGRVTALHPIEPRHVNVERLPNGELLFHETATTGVRRTWTQREVIYVRLFTVDGVLGLSPIGLQRETMGLGIAMRKHGARFFRDSAIPSGALTVPEPIKEEKVRERLRAEWQAKHGDKRGVAILDAGAKFETISIPMEDAQFVELWGATRADIADCFNMPPSLLGASTGDSLTYGNRESDMQHFVTFTLHNPLKKVEQAFTRDRDLYPRPQGKKTHFVQGLQEELLRPDSKARAAFYRLALDEKTGWLNRDEVRRMENLPAEDEAEQMRVARAAMNGENGHHPGREVLKS